MQYRLNIYLRMFHKSFSYGIGIERHRTLEGSLQANLLSQFIMSLTSAKITLAKETPLKQHIPFFEESQ